MLPVLTASCSNCSQAAHTAEYQEDSGLSLGHDHMSPGPYDEGWTTAVAPCACESRGSSCDACDGRSNTANLTVRDCKSLAKVRCTRIVTHPALPSWGQPRTSSADIGPQSGLRFAKRGRLWPTSRRWAQDDGPKSLRRVMLLQTWNKYRVLVRRLVQRRVIR